MRFLPVIIAHIIRAFILVLLVLGIFSLLPFWLPYVLIAVYFATFLFEKRGAAKLSICITYHDDTDKDNQTTQTL